MVYAVYAVVEKQIDLEGTLTNWLVREGGEEEKRRRKRDGEGEGEKCWQEEEEVKQAKSMAIAVW